MKNQIIFEQLKSAGKLPSPPKLVNEILKLSQSDSAGLVDIAKLLELDPGLSGKVISYANSAGFSGDRNISSVVHAITRIGMSITSQLTLSFSLISKYNNGSCRAFDHSKFWLKCLAKATACRILTQENQFIDPDITFTLGLLSEVGRLALATHFPQEYSEILESTVDENALKEAELAIFSINNAQLSAFILENWGFSSSFIEALNALDQEHSITDMDVLTKQIVSVLNLAESIANLCLSEKYQQDQITDIKRAAKEYPVSDAVLSEIINQTIVDWTGASKLFQLPTLDRPEFDKALLNKEGQNTEQNGEIQLLVLVVDDDPLTLISLKKLITQLNHKVITAKDGVEAQQKILEYSPQLIITDWVMPEMDGLALCRALRKIDVCKHLYIIILTSCETDQELVEAFEAGADDYVVKPFSPQVLSARLKSAQRLIQQHNKIEQATHTIQSYANKLKTTNIQLNQLAMHDALTNLPNRRYVMEYLGQKWTEASQEKEILCCILIDIDFFKKVNDLNGHDAGDYVLEKVANTLKQTIRSKDIVSRLGGEEFLFVGFVADINMSLRIAERLRVAIEKLENNFKGQYIPVTISSGIGLKNSSMNNYDQLIKAADNALYQSKHNGRNQFTLFH